MADFVDSRRDSKIKKSERKGARKIKNHRIEIKLTDDDLDLIKENAVKKAPETTRRLRKMCEVEEITTSKEAADEESVKMIDTSSTKRLNSEVSRVFTQKDPAEKANRIFDDLATLDA